MYPMLDNGPNILPREAFQEPETKDKPIIRQTSKKVETKSEELKPQTKLQEDKAKRQAAAEEQHKCHLQQRPPETNNKTYPSEYKRQFVQFPIEKAYSIPQISHIQMHGEFQGVPEYQDSFKMYSNYSKSAPIKKVDNLQISGAENPIPINEKEQPEYKDKFCGPTKQIVKEKNLKTEDHLYLRGEFSKDVPEYYESYQDPQIKQMPERGKCREPYLRLKGKIEFNPEYRNTYLDFPRSRPIVRKPASSFRLPVSNSTTTTSNSAAAATDSKISPPHTPRQRVYKSISPKRMPYSMEVSTTDDITSTPEYRRAHYNYQIRERTPTRTGSPIMSAAAAAVDTTPTSGAEVINKIASSQKRRPSRHRQTSMLDKQAIASQTGFENISQVSKKKPAKFGRRASVLQNASNCRTNSSITEGNPKYAVPSRFKNSENRDAFVVLDDPCKRTNWMKTSWYQ